MHGAPKILVWDKGSANTATGIKRVLEAIGVAQHPHTTEHPEAKGQVEQANNLIERQFEARLRFEPRNTVEKLNAAAWVWCYGSRYFGGSVPHTGRAN